MRTRLILVLALGTCAMASDAQTESWLARANKRVSEANDLVQAGQFGTALQKYGEAAELASDVMDLKPVTVFCKARMGSYAMTAGEILPILPGKGNAWYAGVLGWTYLQSDRRPDAVTLLKQYGKPSEGEKMGYGLSWPTQPGTDVSVLSMGFLMAAKRAPKVGEGNWLFEHWALQQAVACDPSNWVIRLYTLRREASNWQSPEEKAEGLAAMRAFYESSSADIQPMIKKVLESWLSGT